MDGVLKYNTFPKGICHLDKALAALRLPFSDWSSWNTPLDSTSWWITARGLVNVFLFCIMAQIIEASRDVQASSGGTHCRGTEQSKECGVTRKGLHQLSLHNCSCAPYQTAHDCLPQKTEALGILQRTINNLGDTYSGRPSIVSAVLKDANSARQLINVFFPPVRPTKQLKILALLVWKIKKLCDKCWPFAKVASHKWFMFAICDCGKPHALHDEGDRFYIYCPKR